MGNQQSIFRLRINLVETVEIHKSDAGDHCTTVYCSLAIDVGRQKLYYSRKPWRGVGKLGELSTDGTGHRVLIAANDSKPRGVVIDDVNRFETVFFTYNNIYDLAKQKILDVKFTKSFSY